MDKEKMAEVIGEGFGAMFPEVAAQEAAQAKKPVPEKPEQGETEEPLEDSPASTNETSGGDEVPTSDEPVTEAAGDQDEKTEQASEESVEDDGLSRKEKTRKRIEELTRERAEARAQAQQYQQMLNEMQQRVKTLEETSQKANKPKSWEDLSVAELKAIKGHPSATDDQRAMAEQHMETALLREAEERATKAAQKMIQEQMGQVTAQQRQTQVVQELYSRYPDISKDDSPLRQAAKEVWEKGIPEYGITASELQSKPEGLRIAVDHAFNTKFSTEERKAMMNKVKTLQNKVSKQQARSQLEGNGRPSSAAPAKRSPIDPVKDYRSGKMSLEKVIDERIGHLIKIPQE